MERSEPTLVPEWLRSAGSVTGGGSSVPHSASSSSHAGTINFPSYSQLSFTFLFCIVFFHFAGLTGLEMGTSKPDVNP